MLFPLRWHSQCILQFKPAGGYCESRGTPLSPLTDAEQTYTETGEATAAQSATVDLNNARPFGTKRRSEPNFLFLDLGHIYAQVSLGSFKLSPEQSATISEYG